MKKLNPNLKKTTKKFFANRFSMVIVILALTLSMGKSQNLPGNSDYRPVIKPSDIEKVQPLTIQQNAEKNTVVVSKKSGAHAPDANAPDYEAKKAEWIKNYPDEYKAFSGIQENIPSDNKEIVKTSTAIHPASKPHTKIAEHAPYLDDPNYEAKKTDWIKQYPDEFEAVLQKSSGSKITHNAETPKVENQPAAKIAEHAPYLNDPEYAAKKAEWIKNYPDEYNAVMNKNAGSNKNTTANPISQPVKQTSGQTTDKNKPGFDATRK